MKSEYNEIQRGSILVQRPKVLHCYVGNRNEFSSQCDEEQIPQYIFWKFDFTKFRRIQDFFTDISQYIVSVEIPQNTTFCKIFLMKHRISEI